MIDGLDPDRIFYFGYKKHACMKSVSFYDIYLHNVSSFFRTPLYRNSNQMAHSIEHCIFEPLIASYETFLSDYHECTAVVNIEYTQISASSL